MNMKELLETSAREFAESEAIVFGEEHISYHKLNRWANRIAAILEQQFHIGRGHRVAVLLKNHPVYAAALFGIFKIGAVAIPINSFLAGEEIKFILEDAGASLLVTSSDFTSGVKAAQEAGAATPVFNIDEGGPGKGKSLMEPSAVTAPDDPAISIDPDDDAMFVYTSGTTGKPKAAVLTHRNLRSNLSSSIRHIQLKPDDVFLCILPLFHSFTLMVNLFVPLGLGAKVALVESIRPLERVLETLFRERCTILIGIPQLFNVLAYKELPENVRKMIRLRMCISGSAPLPEATLNAFQKNFEIPLLEGYGLSEASPVVSVNPLDDVRKVGSVGLPLPDVEVKIFDDDDQELPAGRTGEVVIRGPNVMKEYYQREEDTAQALRSGWLHTGDIGKIDEGGYLYIIDRKKDMLISKGMNIYPREIEEALYQHPKVAGAAVVGRVDDTQSETPVAFVRLCEGATAEQAELIKYLKQKLARYKVPREIIFIDEFPRTSTGKILKRRLREQLLQQTP